GAPDDRRAAAPAAPGPVGELAQRGAIAADGHEIGPGEAQPGQVRARRPELAAEPPRIQPGHLDARGDHAGGHRILIQRRAYSPAVPVVKEPRSGDTKHVSTLPYRFPADEVGHYLPDRHLWLTRGLHAFGELHGLLDEGLDDRVLGHRLDHLALDEDLPLAVAGRDAEIGLPRLPRPVDHTTHHRDPQRHLHAREPGGDLVGELVDVDLRPPARRAGDDLQLARAQAERLEDLRT